VCRAPGQREESLLSPSRGGFLPALPNAITVALNDRDIGLMQQAIEQRDDAGGIREHLVPFLEGPI
jgi:hypothetical protein